MSAQTLRFHGSALIKMLFATGVLLVFLASDSAAWAQQNTLPPTKTVQEAGQGQILDEIRAIRQRMGGGVGETLKDMFPENAGEKTGDTPQAMFDQSLRQMTAESLKNVKPVLVPVFGKVGTVKPEDGCKLTDETVFLDDKVYKVVRKDGKTTLQFLQHRPIRLPQSVRQPIATTVSSKFSPKTTLPTSSQLGIASQKLAAFRTTARKLEQAAADLEDVGAYDLADNIWEQAKVLRQRARKMDLAR